MNEQRAQQKIYINKPSSFKESKNDAEWSSLEARLRTMLSQAILMKDRESVRKINNMLKVISSNNPTAKVIKSIEKNIENLQKRLYQKKRVKGD